MFKVTQNSLSRLKFSDMQQFTMMMLATEDPARVRYFTEMHKIRYSDIYMIVAVNLWNF